MFPKAKPRVFDLKSVGFFGKFLGGTSHDLAILQLRRAAILQEFRGELAGSEESTLTNSAEENIPGTWTKFSLLFFFWGGGGSDRKDVVFFMVTTCYNLIFVLNFQVLPYRKWLYLGGQPPSVNHQDDMKNPVWMPPVGSRGTGVFL